MISETREELCREALISPVGEFRPMTAGSCCILGLMNSPLAALSEDALGCASELEIIAWAWVHSAPLEEVREQVVAARKTPDVLFQHVLTWAEKKDPDFFSRAYAACLAELRRVGAGMAVYSKPTHSKNGYGQSGSFPWPLWLVKTASALGRVFSGCFRCLCLSKLRTPKHATTAAK